MLTFSTRENDETGYRTRDELMRMVSDCLRDVAVYYGQKIPYVIVAERHPTNLKHWHVHVAVRGFIDVNVVRRIWWKRCGGDGMGAVYVKRAPNTGWQQSPAKIARYLSKYITKEHVQDDLLFNKKRYWSPDYSLPPVRKYWLRAANLGTAKYEVERMLHINLDDAYFFEDGTGLWYEYNVEEHGQDPPAF